MALSAYEYSLRKLKRNVAFAGRAYFIKTNRYKPLFHLNCKIYAGFERIVRAKLCTVQGVVTSFLVHGHATGELFPGLSDFDLVLIIDEHQNPSVIAEVRSIWNKLRQLLPVRDVSLLSETDFQIWQSSGGGMDPLDELQHWKLLSGKDIRSSKLMDLSSPIAERDRQRFAFASYQRLLQSALKDELNLNYLNVSLRRQIYKYFCAAVTPLDRKYLSNKRQVDRLRQWSVDHSAESFVSRLLLLRENRFHKGEISRLCFDAAAHAYQALDDVSNNPFKMPWTPWPACETKAELFNLKEIEARARRFTNELVRQHRDRLWAATIVSNGSTRGYVLHIILRNGLSHAEVVETLRHVHTVFRMFDDPWFNEHYPGGAPIVLSERAWQRVMTLWDFYRPFYLQHPVVLFGDISLAATGVESRQSELALIALSGEQAALGRYYNQALLEASIPALFDIITLYLPRLAIQKQLGVSPTTNEEAIATFKKCNATLGAFADEVLHTYGKLDIDGILRDFPRSLFDKHRDEIRALLLSPGSISA